MVRNMPIPIPGKNETKNVFVSKCTSFLKHENENRKDKRSDEQILAICIGTYERHRKKNNQITRKVELQAAVKVKMLGNALQLRGELLKEGTWVGLDGVPTYYSKEFIKKVRSSIVGTPIRFAHSISESPLTPDIPKGETVGFWTKTYRNGSLDVAGYVFNPNAIKFCKENPKLGLSMEADVITSFDKSLGIENAEDGILTGGVLIENPACPTCTVVSTRDINLERGKKGKKTMEGKNATKEPFLEIVETEEKEFATPTRDSFFGWVEKQMKEAGAPDSLVPKVMSALKKSIKKPFSLSVPKKQEGDWLKLIGDAFDIKELEAYTEFMTTCTKDGKSTEKCLALWKEKHQEEKKEEDDEKEKTPKEEELEKALAETKTELESVKKEVNVQLEEEITGLVGDIKEFEKEFDSKRFLEHIECKSLQKKMLQKYLGVLKTHAKPINLQIGEEKAKKKVLQVTQGMFGKDTLTFEDIFPEAKESK